MGEDQHQVGVLRGQVVVDTSKGGLGWRTHQATRINDRDGTSLGFLVLGVHYDPEHHLATVAYAVSGPSEAELLDAGDRMVEESGLAEEGDGG